MSEPPRKPARPTLTPRAQAAAEARRAREAEALRENLRRRKQQARERAGEEEKRPGALPLDPAKGREAL
jgi:hypothetical protein